MGDEWRLQRVLISPALTSSRIKQSYQKMQNVCQQMLDFIKHKGLHTVNGKDVRSSLIPFNNK